MGGRGSGSCLRRTRRRRLRDSRDAACSRFPNEWKECMPTTTRVGQPARHKSWG
jgi:hypothetical protein